MIHNAQGRVPSTKKDRISRSDRRQGPRKRPRDCALELSPHACNKKRAGEPTLPVLDNELVVNDNACDFIARDVFSIVFN